MRPQASLGLPLDSSLLVQASLELTATLPQAAEPQQFPLFLHPVIPPLTLHAPLTPSGCPTALCSEDRSQLSGRTPHCDEHWAELKVMRGVTTVKRRTHDSGDFGRGGWLPLSWDKGPRVCAIIMLSLRG